MYCYDDAFVQHIGEDVARLIAGETIDSDDLLERLRHLATANNSIVADYWAATRLGQGIPDSAFKTRPPYLFGDRTPERTFHTSGTTGSLRGSASYSSLGMELMRLSILQSARRNVIADLDHPAVIRLVPPESVAPQMVMAFGMELIATSLGHSDLSTVVVGPGGVDYEALIAALRQASEAAVPVVLIGASLAFANACEALECRGVPLALAPGSRVVDAGGVKGMSREIRSADLRAALRRTFGVDDDRVVNLFGMTELASQLYDCSSVEVGPQGERPKGATAYVQPRVVDPQTMEACDRGIGLLTVTDLCLVDRPPDVLTGDMALACEAGVAITGRVARGSRRGCSLSVDVLTRRELTHA